MPSTASLVVAIPSLLLALILFQPRLVRLRTWRATVTPLASIIGSGFLVLAPILLREFGAWAPWVMGALCLAGYSIGAAIRFNITQIGDRGLDQDSTEARLDHLASWALSLAYIITVAYYLALFGSFAVSLTPFDQPLSGKLVTSTMLVFIGVLGWLHGLRGLEWAEELSVAIKLSIIGGMLCGIAWYVCTLYPEQLAQPSTPALQFGSVQVALGLLITVQGFETSRYLGREYSVQERVRSMRHAQWLSTLVYLAYIGLATYAFPVATIGSSETAVVGMTAVVAAILPPMLVAAALSAQFSAAVADTNGCGGLVHEVSSGRIKARIAYLGIALFGLVLTWSVNVFQIIALASRAFALYYLLQCLLAVRLGWKAQDRKRMLVFGLIAVLCALVVGFGIPAEGTSSGS